MVFKLGISSFIKAYTVAELCPSLSDTKTLLLWDSGPSSEW